MARKKCYRRLRQLGKDLVNPMRALLDDDDDDDEYKIGLFFDDDELQDVNEKEKNV